MGVEVRRLSVDEARALRPALLELAVRSKASWGYDPDFMDGFADFMGDPAHGIVVDAPGRVVLVAEDGSALVGFSDLATAPEPAWLDDLWIEPAAFGRGIGRALWDAAVAAARAAGRQAIELEADPYAQGFYERMGATVIREHESSVIAGRILPVLRLDLG
jgi:ribosomal protein S18 acetylase RimI-like enzyme